MSVSPLGAGLPCLLACRACKAGADYGWGVYSGKQPWLLLTPFTSEKGGLRVRTEAPSGPGLALKTVPTCLKGPGLRMPRRHSLKGQLGHSGLGHTLPVGLPGPSGKLVLEVLKYSTFGVLDVSVEVKPLG